MSFPPQNAPALRTAVPKLGRRSLLAAAGSLLAAPALAAWPDRPIRIVVPYAPGGPTDISARIIADGLTHAGWRCVVENRTGGGAVVGSQVVAQAAPDGYTFLLSTIAHAVMPLVAPELTFDPHRDLVPVALLGTLPLVGVVAPSLPPADIPSFIAAAKASPNAFSYASAGNGTAQHLAGELFKKRAGIQMEHVPYRGMGPAMTDIVAGTVTFAFDTILTSLPNIRGSRVKALGVSVQHRIPELPEVAPVSDTLPGYEAYTWNLLFAPRGTPQAIQDDVAAQIRKLLTSDEIGGKLRGLGTEVTADTTPAKSAAFVQAEIDKWVPLLRDAVPNGGRG